MSFKNKIYDITKIILGAVLIVLFAVLSISAVKKQSNEKVRAIAIDIQGDGLLTKSAVIALFKKNFGKKYSNKNISQTELVQIERILNNDLYIEDSNVYIDRNNKIHLSIRECKPLFRLIDKEGIHQYIDVNQKKIPIQVGRNLRIPIVTVAANAKMIPSLKNLIEFVSLIDGDVFMRALTEQIHVESISKIWLIPKIGKEKILIGSLTDLEDKINKIKIFYTKGLKAKGWNTYKEINVSFNDQIVCTET